MLTVLSEDFDEAQETSISALSSLRRRGSWVDYPFGVATALVHTGACLAGANLLIRGEVPIGAGLSSSAALEVATALALLGVSGISMERTDVARVCQRAENEFVGARCGIMDQFVACHARAGYALLLDCRSLEYECLSLPADVEIVVCNTMVKHDLATGEYNQRRADCAKAVQRLSAVLPGIAALRDVDSVQVEQNRELLGERIYHRAKHVVEENARVQRAAKALRSQELPQLGTLMSESHASLRNLYEVSSPELDLMVELAARQPGVYGSRMTGAGLGGSTLHLVETRLAGGFRRGMTQAYEKETGIRPDIYICGMAEAASEFREQPE
jgi:galactokinase